MVADQLRGYTAVPGSYDELLNPHGQPRIQWRGLLEHLHSQGSSSVRDNAALVDRLIVDSGVTYNVYGDPRGADRPWTLDALPLLLTADEWQDIERGVAQRARLLNAVVSDLYGPQQLLRAGVLPPELAFGHPNYLWQCKGTLPHNDAWLSLLAVDLARAPDGRWWVLGDRAQTPSGAGYAMENRQIMGRVWPGLLRDLQVRRLGEFLDNLGAQLCRDSVPGKDAVAVLLTSGPLNETYFEHVYLAGQLGLTLVEGNDLTVRDDTVYLRTLTGIKRVHTILRRLDDDYCDPVELRSDSALGVPGLLSAVRASKVHVANALGSGVIESPAWLGFLPGVSQLLWEEDLILPSVATWWCGERPALDYVCSHLRRLVIKPTYPNQSTDPVFGDQLTETECVEWQARLQARPHAFVAQERFSLSRVPVLRQSVETDWLSRAVSVRVYACWTPNGYRVMPGGLARIAGETSADVVSSQRGGGSKDVWVLPPRQRDLPLHAAQSQSQSQSATQQDVSPRNGENLFWFGRYQERCGFKLRLLGTLLNPEPGTEATRLALAACERLGLIVSGADASGTVFDPSLAQGIVADVQRLHWSATQIRPRLSADHWRAISDLQRRMRYVPRSAEAVRETLDAAVLSLGALPDLPIEAGTQDLGWQMMSLGRWIEHAQNLCSAVSLQTLNADADLEQGLDWLLKINGGTTTLRSSRFSQPTVSDMLKALLLDTTNPRALTIQCAMLSRSADQPNEPSLSGLLQELNTSFENLVNDKTLQLRCDRLETSQSGQVIATGLIEIENALRRFSDELVQRHFAHDSDQILILET